MDLQSLYYFKELTYDLNITKCAERLFVSPQTLSNHILRLEKEYQVQLFKRKPVFMLTDAGNTMLKFANLTLTKESQMKNIFADINNNQSGIIRFGSNTIRANCTLPSVLPAFSEKYPKVQLQLTDSITKNLEDKLFSGELDLILSTFSAENSLYEEELRVPYKIYLCVGEQLLDRYYGEEKEALKEKSKNGANLKDFAKLPFLLLTPPNIIGYTLIKCFEEAGYSPIQYMASSYTDASSLVCSNSLAACFMSQTFWASPYIPSRDNVNIFPILLKGKPVTQEMVLLRRKDQFLPSYTQYFIELMKKRIKEITIGTDYAHLV